MRLFLYVLTVGCLLWTSCRKASHDSADQNPAPLPAPEPAPAPATPQPDPPSKNPGNEKPPEPRVVGPTFADISQIFVNPKYGSCASCHTSNNWPQLDDSAHDGWNKFLSSADGKHDDVTTPQQLAEMVLACVDPTNETHCAGDPTTAEDNVDTKMPTRFGFDTVSASDISLFKTWLNQGARP